MKGQIDTRYLTLQQDIFDSGLARKVGMNALVIWLAIKSHSDFNTGECWPGIRHLMDVTGLASATVQKSIKMLLEENMLRVVDGGKGKRTTRYIPREKLVVYVGKIVLCTIVVDYIPAQIPETLTKLKASIDSGDLPMNLTDCEIIPGPDFAWNSDKGQLTAKINTLFLQQDLFITGAKAVKRLR